MRLHTLGGLELEGGELRRPKPLLLLAYLALEGPQERVHLAELFFRGGSRGRGNLSTTLSRLRRSGPDLVRSDDARVWTEVATDVDDLRKALASNDLARAAQLYRGRFLAGFDSSGAGPELEEWIYSRREALAEQVREALLRLAEQTAVPGQFDRAAAHAERAWLLSGAAEPEPATLRRIFTLLRSGDHPQAADVRAEAQRSDLDLDLTVDQARRQLLASWETHGIPPTHTRGWPSSRKPMLTSSSGARRWWPIWKPGWSSRRWSPSSAAAAAANPPWCSPVCCRGYVSERAGVSCRCVPALTPSRRWRGPSSIR